MKLKVYSGRIAVKKKEVKLKGAIQLPPSRAKLYEIGEVVDIGDLTHFGANRDQSTKEVFSPGDLVLFQVAQAMVSRVSFNIKGTLTAFLHVWDIIGRLTSDTIEYESFRIVGKYVLLQENIREPSKLIVLPQQFEPETKDEITHYSVLQKGADVDGEYDIGQEVFPDRGAGNRITIDNRDMVFIDQAHICGALALK
jgi:co-chaperonin GroES (HSP10)